MTNGFWRTAGLMAAMVSGLLAAGCAPVTYTRILPITPGQKPGALYSYVAKSGGPMVLEVYSPPAGVTAGALAAAMPPPPGRQPVHFVPAGAMADLKPDLAAYRFVLVFAAPDTFDGDDACLLSTPVAAGDMAAPTGGDGLLAAFCHKTENLTQVRATGEALRFPDGVGGERGQAVLHQISGYLVPSQQGDPQRCGMFQPC